MNLLKCIAGGLLFLSGLGIISYFLSKKQKNRKCTEKITAKVKSVKYNQSPGQKITGKLMQNNIGRNIIGNSMLNTDSCDVILQYTYKNETYITKTIELPCPMNLNSDYEIWIDPENPKNINFQNSDAVYLSYGIMISVLGILLMIFGIF